MKLRREEDGPLFVNGMDLPRMPQGGPQIVGVGRHLEGRRPVYILAFTDGRMGWALMRG